MAFIIQNIRRRGLL